jgi:hypothetical protein
VILQVAVRLRDVTATARRGEGTDHVEQDAGLAACPTGLVVCLVMFVGCGAVKGPPGPCRWWGWGPTPTRCIPLRDVIQLRLSEDLYSLVRGKLTELANAVARNNEGDPTSFRSSVHDHAEELVLPVLDKITAKAKRSSRFATIAGFAAGKFARLTIHGFATLAGDATQLGSRPISSAADTATRKLVAGRLDSSAPAYHAARSVLLSVMREPPTW